MWALVYHRHLVRLLIPLQLEHFFFFFFFHVLLVFVCKKEDQYYWTKSIQYLKIHSDHTKANTSLLNENMLPNA